MSIWSYDGKVRDIAAIKTAIELMQCTYCGTSMEVPRKEEHFSTIGVNHLEVRYCAVCGWWTKRQFVSFTIKNWGSRITRGATGSLRELDLSDQFVPIEEIRAYLAAKYDARFQVEPYKFENVVASVYKDLGFRVRVTGRSGDGGIDVILEGGGDLLIGVQVKRYKEKINVEQIRSLAGALFLEGITRGIFVTTSSFQSGAQQVADKSRLRGIPIELIDAKSFYEALGLAQRNKYETESDPTAPFFDVPLVELHSEPW